MKTKSGNRPTTNKLKNRKNSRLWNFTHWYRRCH